MPNATAGSMDIAALAFGSQCLHHFDEASSRKRKREALGDPDSCGQADTSNSITTDWGMSCELVRDESTEVTTDGAVASTVAGLTQTIPEPKVPFHLGGEIRQVLQSKFLSYVWGNGLDSNCLVCGEQFVLGAAPPVRTIGFEYSQTPRLSMTDITQTALAPHPIRIYNRHLGCIKSEKIDYIPVSHAWHEVVAKAQDDHVEDINAAWLAYQTPIKSLLAVTKKYGPIEIWHDYLSVPQWRKETQQHLLLAIPAIYHYPQSTMIHLDDVRACYLSQAYVDQSYKTFIAGLSSITRSRWFDRMWVTLEYMQSNEVLMLTEEYEVSDINASDLSLRISNVAAKYVKRHGHDKFMQDLAHQRCRWVRNVSWGDMESWKSRLDKHRTFGAATYIMGLKQCRKPRDYYLALGAMIGLKPKDRGDFLQPDDFECFLSLALYALDMGDYTPLLFNPLPKEQPDVRAPWLRGYSQMSEKLWDLGVCHQEANSKEIIKDGIIQPELESVGIIEWFEHKNFEGEPENVFMDVASHILRSSGTCSTAFCAAVDRIFTRNERKALYTEWELIETRKPMPSLPSYDYASLGRLLEEFSTLQYGSQCEQAAQQMLGLSRQMIRLLQLDQPGKQSADSRMVITHAEAQWYVNMYGQDMEGLGRVRCKICARRSLFRLTLWETPKLESTQVYRIPGLLFDETIPEGIGLVVCEGILIGKMVYGTPACECCRLERVKFGNVGL